MKTPFLPVAEQSCLNCIYLRDSFCRRNAPVAFAEPATCRGPVISGSDWCGDWVVFAEPAACRTYDVQAFWPVVSGSDWCGEWFSREVGL